MADQSTPSIASSSAQTLFVALLMPACEDISKMVFYVDTRATGTRRGDKVSVLSSWLVQELIDPRCLTGVKRIETNMA
jgi:hypothetical protein